MTAEARRANQRLMDVSADGDVRAEMRNMSQRPPAVSQHDDEPLLVEHRVKLDPEPEATSCCAEMWSWGLRKWLGYALYCVVLPFIELAHVGSQHSNLNPEPNSNPNPQPETLNPELYVPWGPFSYHHFLLSGEE